MSKLVIKEVVVVEGEHDASRLKQFFDVETITTNGSAINEQTLQLIKNVNEKKGVIVFCDPDYPGEKIRQTIIDYVGECKHAFIKKNKAVDNIKHKVGIEHADYEDLLESLKCCVSFRENDVLEWVDYVSCDLVGNKSLRQKVCDYLKISCCNSKTLFKRLNMLEINYNKLKEIIEEVE